MSNDQCPMVGRQAYCLVSAATARDASPSPLNGERAGVKGEAVRLSSWRGKAPASRTHSKPCATKNAKQQGRSPGVRPSRSQQCPNVQPHPNNWSQRNSARCCDRGRSHSGESKISSQLESRLVDCCVEEQIRASVWSAFGCRRFRFCGPCLSFPGHWSLSP